MDCDGEEDPFGMNDAVDALGAEIAEEVVRGGKRNFFCFSLR